jgi:glutamate/tyrosine decarboxylase-like PLP-dependent enzyme
VINETWTDANPMFNLSSFVTTVCEPEAKEIHDGSMFRNFADPDMYPRTKETEFRVHTVAPQPLEWSRSLASHGHLANTSEDALGFAAASE